MCISIVLFSPGNDFKHGAGGTELKWMSQEAAYETRS